MPSGAAMARQPWASARRCAGSTCVTGDDLRHVTGVRMTPTFVLLHGGQEVGRILGYIDSPNFWRQLQALMWQVPTRAESASLNVPARATE